MESYKLTADEIMELNPEIAIIPIGSLEQHGPHLPIMTDWAIAADLGRRVAEKMNAFLLPALPISNCHEQMGKKGSVWMQPTTLYQMMKDIILCLKGQGFKKVGILQCHGGIFVLTPLVRELNATYNPDLMVALIDSRIYAEPLIKEGIYETTTELHAGEGETSKMLAIAPETVHMDRAVDEVPTLPRNYLGYGNIFRLSKSGVWGEATRASREKGERVLERSCEIAVEELNKAFSFMENKQEYNGIYF